MSLAVCSRVSSLLLQLASYNYEDFKTQVTISENQNESLNIFANINSTTGQYHELVDLSGQYRGLVDLHARACTLLRQPDASEQQQRQKDRAVLNGAADYRPGKTDGGHKFSEETEVLTALGCLGVIANRATTSENCLGNVQHRMDTLCTNFPHAQLQSHIIHMREQPLLQTGVSSICSEWHGLDKAVWSGHHCLKTYDIENINDVLKTATSNMDASRDIFVGRKCAVVGNSGNLLNAGHGQDIDQHEVVVRFGCAPTRNFEVDVGTKTDFRFVYPEALGADGGDQKSKACGGIVDLAAEGSTFLVRLYKYLEIDWWAKMLKTNPPRRVSNKGFWHTVPESIPRGIGVSVLNPAWVDEIHRSFGMTDSTMSQGIVGVLLALESGCSAVDIYGFGSSRADGKSIPLSDMHYYE